MTNKDKKELVIIGAGPGGYAAAFRAADLGIKVTLIGPDVNPGGTCLYHGCIPAKTLLELLKIKEAAAEAEEMGLSYDNPEIDLEKIAEWKSSVVNELTEGIGLLSKERNVEYIPGKAVFTSQTELEVETNEGEKFSLEFEKAIVATGSLPKELPDIKFDHKKILNSKDALELKSIPENMLIIGGGYIGPELGSVYAALGSKVSLAEKTNGFLSWADKDLSKIFQKTNEGLYEEVWLETTVEKMNVENEKVKVRLKNQQEEWEKEYDLVLIAIGRIANTSDLNLDKAGIEKDENGFIKVDEKRKTSRENIYAIGDVTQKPLFANKATHEGRIAAEVIAGKKHEYKPKAIPSIVTTTKTEITWCGIMENEAKENGIEIKVTKFPWAASGRAATLGNSNGLTKLIFDAESGVIIGGGVVGKKAGNLISEITLAIEMAATSTDISLSIHPHPTLSESIMEASEMFSGNSTHFRGK